MMTERAITMSRLYELAEEDFRDSWSVGADVSDLAHDIAGRLVPVYTYDLLKLALEDLSLATDEPELGPVYDGKPTVANILSANVYERIYNYIMERAEDWVRDLSQTDEQE